MTKNMSDEAVQATIGSIATFSDGGHPFPERKNLDHFTPEFVLECLEQARNWSRLPEAARAGVDEAIEYWQARSKEQA